MINDTGEMVRIHRHEKGGDYIAQGGTLTREALNDLRELYFSEGTNVEQYNHYQSFIILKVVILITAYL